ncbi:MAG TPA: carbon monoxide dehydrogenase subunit G [Burkholderiales bacterium]|jgi:carbon monoxide dehydrogenase subunit G|nr:carbon monoxide dehydrogenase subunit G [Burkholderiales bacterium]
MEMTGEQLVPLSQDATWRALNDIAILKASIPGCESIEQAGENAYQLTMTAKVGPVSARFKGKMTLADINAPHSYKLVFEGQGGVAGFAKGEAEVALAPENEATRLRYAVKAMVGGKLAQVGSRLIDGVARKTAEQFFSTFNRQVTGSAASSADGG